MKLVNVNRPCNTPKGFEQLVNELFKDGENYDRYGRSELSFTPSSNVFETEDSFQLELAAPGFGKNEITMSVEGNVLVVSGKQGKEEEREYKYIRREFSVSNFEKSFRLSKKIDQEKINASFENGILRVSLPKKEEAIPVKRQIDLA